jgi:ankyrin repeat domain-containing protein 50
MITAHENERFAEVLKTTRAIMFMGTPHRGSEIASSLRPLVEAINFGLRYTGGSAIVGTIKDELIAMLERNSSALDEMNESFIPRVKDKQIISCYELEWPEKMNQLVSSVICDELLALTRGQVVSKQSALLRILEEEDIPLQASHMNLCRFSSSQDSRYRLVAGALLRVARTISGTAEDLNSISVQSIYCELPDSNVPALGAEGRPYSFD